MSVPIGIIVACIVVLAASLVGTYRYPGELVFPAVGLSAAIIAAGYLVLLLACITAGVTA